MAISQDGAKTVLGFRFMTNYLNGFGKQPVQNQSVETATMICTGISFNAGKQIHRRKRCITVDLLGLVLQVLVTSARVAERAGAKLNVQVLADLSDKR